MSFGERFFEFLLIVAVGFCLWTVVVAEASRGVYVNVDGSPLRGERLRDVPGWEPGNPQPVIRLGAAGPAQEGRPLEIDRAIWKLVTDR